jgi:hypothetical protein
MVLVDADKRLTGIPVNPNWVMDDPTTPTREDSPLQPTGDGVQ